MKREGAAARVAALHCIMSKRKKRVNRQLEILREKAHLAERSASVKIRKIAKGTYNPINNPAMSYLNNGEYGVDITGTKYDPRKKRGAIDKMTKKQLTKYIDILREFSKSTNIIYYAGHKDAKTGKPSIISFESMSKLVHATIARNKRLKKYRDEQADMPLPWRGEGMTAGKYNNDWRPHSKYFDSSSAYSLEPAPPPTPIRFVSDKAVRTLAESRMDEITPSAHKRRIFAMREQISEMLKVIGDSTLMRFLDMSDEALWYLWTSDESLADYLAFLYETYKDQSYKDNIIDVLESRAGNSYEEMSMMLQYGENYEEIKRNHRAAKKIKRKPKNRAALKGGRFGDYYKRR